MNLYVISMYPLPLGQPQGASSKQMKETCLLGLAVHLGQPGFRATVHSQERFIQAHNKHFC